MKIPENTMYNIVDNAIGHRKVKKFTNNSAMCFILDTNITLELGLPRCVVYLWKGTYIELYQV